MVYLLATIVVMTLFASILAISVIAGRKPVAGCSVTRNKNTGDEVYCETCSSTVRESCLMPGRK